MNTNILPAQYPLMIAAADGTIDTGEYACFRPDRYLMPAGC